MHESNLSRKTIVSSIYNPQTWFFPHCSIQFLESHVNFIRILSTYWTNFFLYYMNIIHLIFVSVIFIKVYHHLYSNSGSKYVRFNHVISFFLLLTQELLEYPLVVACVKRSFFFQISIWATKNLIKWNGSEVLLHYSSGLTLYRINHELI